MLVFYSIKKDLGINLQSCIKNIFSKGQFIGSQTFCLQIFKKGMVK